MMPSTYQTYANMKDSGVEWLGDIPEGWEKVRFRNFFEFSKGLNITKENLQEKGVPCVNYGEIHSNYGFEFSPEKHPLKCVSEDYITISPKALLQIGDFVFADTSEDIEGSGNFTQLVSHHRSFAGYHTIITRPRQGNNHRFLAYVLESTSYRNQIRQKVKGVKVYSITKSLLKNTFVWFPPLPEQAAIANFLDEKTSQIDAAVAIKKKQIELLKERKQILIQNAVTQGLNPDAPMRDSGVAWIGDIPKHWEVQKLKYLLKLMNLKVESKKTSLQYIGMESIESKTGKLSGIKSEAEGLANYFAKGYILFGKLRPYLAKAYLAEFEGVCSTEFLVYQCSEQSNDKYFSQMLLSNSFVDLVNASTYGSKMPRASADFIGNIKVLLPPFSEQTAIVAHIETQSAKIDQAIDLSGQQIEKLKEYKTTLINSAVTGKIKVT